MRFLQALEQTAFAEWVLVSMLGFPTMIAIHSVGMACAVGLSLVVALRLNGFLIGLDGAQLPALLTVAAVGFAVNAVTGVIIFIPRATEYIVAPTFLIKMACVLGSGGLLFGVRRVLLRNAGPVAAETRYPAALRRLAWLWIAGWCGAIVSGRLIAYLSRLY